MEKYDVIIIGGACAGLSAGLYAGRRALKTLILSKDIGGQAAITTEIENYPGFDAIGGRALMDSFKKQAERYGAEIKMGEFLGAEKVASGFVVKSSVGDFETLSIILAFGLEHRKLGVPGEKEFYGRGVTYCATCDGPLFKGKTVAVVGGGNSAFDAAEYLSGLCEKVYLLHRSDKFRADAVLIDAVKTKTNVEIVTGVNVAEIVGDKKIQSVKLDNGQVIELNGLFVEIGYQPKTEALKGLVELDNGGQVVVDCEAKTGTPGIFAAGDVTNVLFKQVVISAGDGAKAALSAARYVQGARGREDRPDWKRRAQSPKSKV